MKDSAKIRHSNEGKYLYSMLLQFKWKTKRFPCVEKVRESSELDNLMKHIKKVHPEIIPDKPYTQQEVAKKQDKEKVATSMSMVKFTKQSLK